MHYRGFDRNYHAEKCKANPGTSVPIGMFCTSITAEGTRIPCTDHRREYVSGTEKAAGSAMGLSNQQSGVCFRRRRSFATCLSRVPEFVLFSGVLLVPTVRASEVRAGNLGRFRTYGVS